MKEFYYPPHCTVAFDESKGILYNYKRNVIEILRFGGAYPIASKKTFQRPYWVNFIPQSNFPFVFDLPLFKNTRFLGEKRRHLDKHIELYEKLVTYVGVEDVFLTKSFSSRHWFILCLLKNGGSYSRDFVRLNPALSYLLSAHAVFHPLKSKKYWRSVRTLLLKPRKEILAYFGFPRRNSVVKCFQKFPKEMYSLEFFFWLRKELMKRPELIRELSFFSNFSIGSITHLLSGLSKYLTHELIETIAQQEEERAKPLSYFHLKDIVRIHASLEDYEEDRPIPIFGHYDAIEDYHDVLVDRINRLEVMTNHEYTQSALQDIHQENFVVEKITDSFELHAEGVEMDHCIFSYEKDLLKGGTYVARVLKPQRLTILYKEYDTTYRLIEVRGKHNCEAEPEAFDMITYWLRGFSDFDSLKEKKIFNGKDQLWLFEELSEKDRAR